MHPDLENLVALDRLDRAIERTRREAKEALNDLKQATEALDAARRLADSLQDQLATSRDAQHAAERQAKRYRDRKKSAENVLSGGGGDFEAAERQVAECDRILDDLETQILEQLELQDDLVARMHGADEGIAEATESLRLQETTTPEVVEAQRTRRAELVAERKTHEAALPPDVLDRYDRLVARKRRAVAPLRDEACGACMQTVRSQERIELKRERMVPCSNCHRWLYLEEPA